VQTSGGGGEINLPARHIVRARAAERRAPRGCLRATGDAPAFAPRAFVGGKGEDMMGNKHLRPDETPVDLIDDLERNPGIGQSAGAFALDPGGAELIEGENTFEGDRDNDAGLGGGIDKNVNGRANR